MFVPIAPSYTTTRSSTAFRNSLIRKGSLSTATQPEWCFRKDSGLPTSHPISAGAHGIPVILVSDDSGAPRPARLHRADVGLLTLSLNLPLTLVLTFSLPPYRAIILCFAASLALNRALSPSCAGEIANNCSLR